MSVAKGREGLILPTHTLVGLAIELLLKVVYLHRNGDPAVLKRPNIRHNLAVLRSLARDRGFSSRVIQIGEIIDIIGETYATHEYRYMRPGSTIHFVHGVTPVTAIKAFADEIAREVGLPVRPSQEGNPRQ